MNAPPASRRRRALLLSVGAIAAAPFARIAAAVDPVRIGLILPQSGPFASTGREVAAAVRLYQQVNGTTAGGREVEVIVKDDTGLAPETTRRLAQEFVVRDRVGVLAGFGLTPLALAAAPVATEAKVPMVVMAAATSIIPQRSPYIVRTSFTLPQVTAPLADWAAKNGFRRVFTLVADYGPGLDAEKTFVKRFTAGGGVIVQSVRAPLANPDYAPFLQRVKDEKPDGLFVFVPAGEGTAVLKQFADRGLKDAGVRLICTGDVLDDELLPAIGPAALGVISAHHYSMAHASPQNKAFVEAFTKANGTMRPNFHAVGGWDGMRAIYDALAKAGGDADGDALVAAMRGASWVSPRGPMSIDAATRDVVQNVYLRRVQMVDGKPYNVEFDRFEQVRDPGPG